MYTSRVIERERPTNKLLRAFILYKVLVDWMDDCQIVINGTTFESHRVLWRQWFNQSFWKAKIVEAYLEKELAKIGN